MGTATRTGWVNPRYLAKTSGSPAELMLAAARELHERWSDGGWDVSVEELIATRETLALIGELLGNEELMPGFVVALREERAVGEDASERVQKAGWAAEAAARDIQYALGHVASDAALRRALVKRGM